MGHLTGDATELVAEMALNFAKELFAERGSETAYQDWKKRKEKADEIQSLRKLRDAP